MFSAIFVAGIKIIFYCDFVAPLKCPSKCWAFVSKHAVEPETFSQAFNIPAKLLKEKPKEKVEDKQGKSGGKDREQQERK